MLYCNPCAIKHTFPESISKSQGKCEICGKQALCNDTPAKKLPMHVNKPGLQDIDPSNVEDSIEMAIAFYEKKGALADCVFWVNVIDILRAKWEMEHKCLEHASLWKKYT